MMTGERRQERKTTGYEILKGVVLEAQRLNRGPRLVPACNTGLIHGNYWILHHPFFFFFFQLLALPCLSDSLYLCTINLPSTFLSFGVWLPSPPFSHHFSLPFHLLMPHCLVSSHHGLSPLASVLCSCFLWQSAVALFRWARLKRNA